jgi:LPS-assembly lipoprotein
MRPKPPAPSRLLAAGAAALLLALAGCGYTPLYATNEQGSTVQDLASVDVKVVPDRSGQQLHNFLRDEINPTGRPSMPRYDLEIDLAETREALAIRTDETATRYNLNQTAQFRLRDLDTGRVVLTGSSHSAVSYNVLRDDFNNIVSENDARRRGVREIAGDIRLRLAAFLNARRQKVAERTR